MEVAFSTTFKKAFRKKNKGSDIEIQFWDKLALFIEDPFDARFKNL